MNVTREVVTDLLPVYFSGEASEDTRQLVEEYFRGHPDFERIARSAARPLDTLRAAAPSSAEAEKEKSELQCIGWELRSRRVWLVMALLFTVWSFAPLVGKGFAEWIGAPHTQAGRIVDWTAAAMFWILYIARPQRRYVPLAGALLLTWCEVITVFVHLNILSDSSAADRSVWAFIGLGALAALLWIWHFRWRARERRAALPSASSGGPH